jgi:hypothetical protein
MERERLQKVFRKTDGKCHLCGRKCTFSKYGDRNAEGGWHVEHSIAKANGGSDHLNNLFPAHIHCNLKKGTKSVRPVRAKNGLTRAPLSRAKKEAIRGEYVVKGVLFGGAFGSATGSPWGTFFGAVIGGLIGNSNAPTK